MENKLTKAILDFKKSNQGLKEIIKMVSIIVYTYPKKYGLSPDECSDFYCYFFPKIGRMVTNFNYNGKPFEAYLYATLKWQIKTFITEKNKNEAAAKILINSNNCFSDTKPYSEIDYKEPEEVHRIPRFTPSSKRRLLYLTIKENYYMDSELKEKAAGLLKINPLKFSQYDKRLSDVLEKKIQKLESLKDRKNKMLLKILKLENNLLDETDYTSRKNIIDRISLEKLRMNKLNEAIFKYRVRPSHKDIAKILKVPKGSVDSGIYYLKKSINFN